MADPLSHAGAPLVQTLWIGGALSRVERLSLASFVATGHSVHLYAYDLVPNVPDGVTLLDASVIAPRENMWRNGRAAGEGAGSWAAAANVFRYALLSRRGGYWVDTDVVALRPLPGRGDYFFAFEDATKINSAVLRLPAGSTLATLLLKTSLAIGPDCTWGETGPRLLTTLVSLFGMREMAAQPESVYPVHYSRALELLQPDVGGELGESLARSWAVHLWNEIWRRAGVDKNRRHAGSSVFESLCRRYDIR